MDGDNRPRSLESQANRARSIDSIPRDSATLKTIRDIIDHQFDLEIYLKHREVATIQQEISKAEQTLRDLDWAISHELNAASLPETPHFTRRTAAAAAAASAMSTANLYNSYLNSISKRSTSKSTHKTSLFGRRSDGVFVRLSCPACKRDDFANQQGFLNHCRLAHDLEFGPYEQIMQRCGTPVDESEVPPDHPARLRPAPIPVPAQRPAKKLKRPSIKVFEEDVDLEMDQTSATDKGYKSRESSVTGEPSSDREHSVPRESFATEENVEKEKNDESNVVRAEGKRPQASKAVPEAERPSHSTASSSNEADVKGSGEPQVESVAVAFATPSENESGSRFYIKRRIIVGNVSKYIPPEKRDPTLKNFSHKWMVYVVEPPQAQKVSTFITAVRFYLHPSYKPHDIVDVTEPPFRLTRLGWGEFPVRIQLFFVDKRRNKCLDIIHQVRLDETHSGKQVLGAERGIDIELDRNTDFKDISSVPGRIPATPSDHASTSSSPSTTTQPATSHVVARQKMSLLSGFLNEAVRQLPILRTAKTATLTLPYTCASSTQMFFNWSVGRRKALEWHRAHLVRISVQQQVFSTNDEVLRTAASALSTKDVVLWCREHHHTPDKSQITDKVFVDGGYCKMCGCLRENHGGEDHLCPHRPKHWPNRKAALNGTSSVSALMSQLPPGWDDVQDTEDVVVDGDDTFMQPSNTSRPGEALVSRIREWTREEGSQNPANELLVDWIWSVVGQLRLKRVIANDMVIGRDGNLQGPTADFDLAGAMDQRVVTGNLLVEATRTFLSRILDKSLEIYREQQAGQGETEPSTTSTTSTIASASNTDKLLVPFHVHQAAYKVPSFDFLTNQYMGSSEGGNE